MDVQTTRQTSKWPTLAIVFGLVSLLFAALIVPGVLAIVFGVLGRRQEPRSRQAIAGIVLGAVTVVAGVAVWVVFWDDIFHSPSYLTLRVGDCYQRPDNDPRYVERQDCRNEHGAEVVALIDHPAGRDVKFPGGDGILQYARPLCKAAAEAYLGRPLEQAPVRTFRIVPSRESWDAGNRRVVCSLGANDAKPLVGSLRDRQSATG